MPGAEVYVEAVLPQALRLLELAVAGQYSAGSLAVAMSCFVELDLDFLLDPYYPTYKLEIVG
jgi:hypothetical protein